jgi:hypothetical protein
MAASFELCFMATFLRNDPESMVERLRPRRPQARNLPREEQDSSAWRETFFSPSTSGSGNVQQEPPILPESRTNRTRSTDADGEGNVQHPLLPISCTTGLDKTAFIDGNEDHFIFSMRSIFPYRPSDRRASRRRDALAARLRLRRAGRDARRYLRSRRRRRRRRGRPPRQDTS